MNENKTNINCLPCIYTVHRLSFYKMAILRKQRTSNYGFQRFR